MCVCGGKGGFCGAYEKDLGGERGGGGVFQSRVINHWLRSKKNYDRFRTTYGSTALPPRSYKHKHTMAFTQKHIILDYDAPRETHQGRVLDAIKKVDPENVQKKWVRCCENCKSEHTDTQKHTGRLVWQGHTSPTFPVLVNFCLFVVVVTSTPYTDTLCQHVFLLFVPFA